METYHIHVRGLVQGVGFRPFVCRVAATMHITGWVSNTGNGVHIECNGSHDQVMDFCNRLLNDPPAHAIITHCDIEKTGPQIFTSFSIRENAADVMPDLLLTPDRALCDVCKHEMKDAHDKRYQYAFTTCLECGPRYSIIKSLPYDRVNTTMSQLHMCNDCRNEYNEIRNHRHYSQTNSCNQCAIPMHLYKAPHEYITNNPETILAAIDQALNEGDTVAVKGIGGYLLLCDATNKESIVMLRKRKHRPHKPLAVLYANIRMARKDVNLRPVEVNALTNTVAPIVLCALQDEQQTGICIEDIAPGLNKIGVMLPYSPLLLLIAEKFGRPLIATSANFTGSPIIYKDEDALNSLFDVSDYILTFDRDIVTPQDDSVMQFTSKEQPVILRRSRGMAPNYFPPPFDIHDKIVLAMGADLKNAFALLTNHKLYVSQYLGNQQSLESQIAFRDTLHHLLHLLKVTPDHILIDKHPAYFVSQEGTALADTLPVGLTAIQHHRAHFAAVLAENNLLQGKHPVLGVIWDGTGYGDDDQIWGGELFLYEDHHMERVAHLDYFSQLLGDKMSKEPRLSAFALLKYFPDQQHVLKRFFTDKEWQYYRQLINQPQSLLTSSMGRLLDGIASILNVAQYNTYEGEAAMQLEALAARSTRRLAGYYHIPVINGRLQWEQLIAGLLQDLEQKNSAADIAWKVFYSLAQTIIKLSDYFETRRIAFSGGVFQNALLTDMITELAAGRKQLYFHRQLSPNDECIGFGQLAYYNLCHQKIKEEPVGKVAERSIKEL